jgi:hypothetical protein
LERRAVGVEITGVAVGVGVGGTGVGIGVGEAVGTGIGVGSGSSPPHAANRPSDAMAITRRMLLDILRSRMMINLQELRPVVKCGSQANDYYPGCPRWAKSWVANLIAIVNMIPSISVLVTLMHYNTRMNKGFCF